MHVADGLEGGGSKIVAPAPGTGTPIKPVSGLMPSCDGGETGLVSNWAGSPFLAF